MPICFTAHVGLTLMYKKSPEKIHTELKNIFFLFTIYNLDNVNRAGKIGGKFEKKIIRKIGIIS